MTGSLEHLYQKLSGNEIAISRLYQQFAESFREDGDFWKQMSLQEIAHSEWIEKFREWAREEKIGSREAFLHIESINTMMDYINSVREKCIRGEISKLKAYALAYDIENSLLEKKFFSAFAFKSTAYRTLQEKLILETENHREKIGEPMKAMRSASL
jgi:hypothetical protein